MEFSLLTNLILVYMVIYGFVTTRRLYAVPKETSFIKLLIVSVFYPIEFLVHMSNFMLNWLGIYFVFTIMIVTDDDNSTVE